MFNLTTERIIWMWLHKEQAEGFNVAAEDNSHLTEIMQSWSTPCSSATTVQQKKSGTMCVHLESATLLSDQNDKKERWERFQLAAWERSIMFPSASCEPPGLPAAHGLLPLHHCWRQRCCCWCCCCSSSRPHLPGLGGDWLCTLHQHTTLCHQPATARAQA